MGVVVIDNLLILFVKGFLELLILKLYHIFVYILLSNFKSYMEFPHCLLLNIPDVFYMYIAVTNEVPLVAGVWCVAYFSHKFISSKQRDRSVGSGHGIIQNNIHWLILDCCV